MRKLISGLITIMVFALMLTGCGNFGPVNKTLTVTEVRWSEMGAGQPIVMTYTELEAGDVIYRGFSSVITIKSVTEDKLVLDIDGYLVEPNADGSIDLRADPLQSFTLKDGDTVEFVTQTMDAGENITITFE